MSRTMKKLIPVLLGFWLLFGIGHLVMLHEIPMSFWKVLCAFVIMPVIELVIVTPIVAIVTWTFNWVFDQ